MIGGNIVVKVVRVEGDQIQLGIQAPREVAVHREEVRSARWPGSVALTGISSDLILKASSKVRSQPLA